VFVLEKTGHYVPCDPPGSRTPAPCGSDAWASQVWTERALVWKKSRLVERWRFTSDWKPAPVRNWEPMFQPALSGSYLYFPGAGGTLLQVNATTGALRRRIDDMSNEEYQALIRLPGAALREKLLSGAPEQAARLQKAIARVSDAELPTLLADLGGHDLAELLAALRDFEASPAQPTVLFAYTIKGWGLPFAGHPLNHSMLLNAEQMDALRAQLGVAAGAEWDGFAPGSPAAELCQTVAAQLREPERAAAPAAVEVPARVAGPFPETTSTQDMFGRILTRLADHAPLRDYLVTTSPDVSISTSLAGWINKTGVYAPREAVDYETETQRLMRWAQRPTGQHIELGQHGCRRL